MLLLGGTCLQTELISYFRLIAFDEDEGETENADIKNDSLSNLYDITSESKF